MMLNVWFWKAEVVLVIGLLGHLYHMLNWLTTWVSVGLFQHDTLISSSSAPTTTEEATLTIVHRRTNWLTGIHRVQTMVKTLQCEERASLPMARLDHVLPPEPPIEWWDWERTILVLVMTWYLLWCC